MTDQPPAGLRILIVEDDPSTRDALTLALRHEGFDVICAGDGIEALRELRGGPRPDLILLDLLMPGMDGSAFLEELRKDPALEAIPVVALFDPGDGTEAVPGPGAVPRLKKPVERDQLLAAIEDAVGRRRPTVLVVDDEAVIRRLLALALPSFGFRVLLAAGGEEAVEMYRHNQEEIDLVLMDVQMPGLDGPWTFFALQGQNPAVRCCFMSGHPGEYGEDLLRAMGARCVVAKPFDLAELARKLRESL